MKIKTEISKEVMKRTTKELSFYEVSDAIEDMLVDIMITHRINEILDFGLEKSTDEQLCNAISKITTRTMLTLFGEDTMTYINDVLSLENSK